MRERGAQIQLETCSSGFYINGSVAASKLSWFRVECFESSIHASALSKFPALQSLCAM